MKKYKAQLKKPSLTSATTKKEHLKRDAIEVCVY
jgi:hypothetical protein